MYSRFGAEQEIAPGLQSPLNYAVSSRDSAVIAMVAEALRLRRARLAYQPVVQARRPDRPAFWEGLIRIFDRTGRTIPAADFMPSVEAHELGREIDTLALDLGLQDLHSHPGLRLSINMSARSIGYPRWTAVLDHWLTVDRTLGERLILEITESSAMMMPDIVRVFMGQLQQRGVSFALDDFGAGYTSFRYLRDFDFDVLKVDGEYIRGISTNPDNQVLVRALIGVAQHFEMFTVAEFVESYEDSVFLTEMGCDCLQGYYFGAPTLSPWWQNEDEARAVG